MDVNEHERLSNFKQKTQLEEKEHVQTVVKCIHKFPTFLYNS